MQAVELTSTTLSNWASEIISQGVPKKETAVALQRVAQLAGLRLASADRSFERCYHVTPKGQVRKKKKKEMKKRKSYVDEEKKMRKPPKDSASCLKKRKGVEAYSLLPQAELRPVQYSTQSALGEESCPALNPLQCFRAAIIYCSLLCAAEGRRKKKRREHWRERKPASLCRKGERELVFIYIGQKKQDFFPPTNSREHLLLFYTAVVTYVWASRAGKQRHPGFSWWWELTSDWFPWILMWRIVCFIEEQKEARWLPFRIC